MLKPDTGQAMKAEALGLFWLMEQLFFGFPSIKSPIEILEYHVARVQQRGLLVGLREGD